MRINLLNLAWQLGGNREAVAQACADADVLLICEVLDRKDGKNYLARLDQLLPEGWASNQDTSSQARGQVAVCWRTSSMKLVHNHPMVFLSGKTSKEPGSPDRWLSSATLRDLSTRKEHRIASFHAPVERTGKQPEFYAALHDWCFAVPNALAGGDTNKAPDKAAARVDRPFVGREVMTLLLPKDGSLEVASTSHVNVRGSDHPIVRVNLRGKPTKENPMSTGIYLEDHPPKRSQFRTGRRAKPTGLIEVHTAESVLDTVGPDTGAEAVAKFIQGRSEPGSYHRLADSDTYVKLVRLSNEAYGDGTGTNPYAVHLSFACRTTDWAKMSKDKRKAMLKQGAKAAVEIMTWLKREHGVTVPLKRISKAAAVKGTPGFMAHGDSDPGRRSDPGVNPPHLFPWDEFFAEIKALMAPAPKPKPELTRGGNIDKALEYLRKANPADGNEDEVAAAIKILTSIKPWPKK